MSILNFDNSQASRKLIQQRNVQLFKGNIVKGLFFYM